jgi:hypothetical protein
MGHQADDTERRHTTAIGVGSLRLVRASIPKFVGSAASAEPSLVFYPPTRVRLQEFDWPAGSVRTRSVPSDAGVEIRQLTVDVDW